MMTQQQVEQLKNDISKRISQKQEQLNLAKDSDQYARELGVISKLMAQYNILLEVLK